MPRRAISSRKKNKESSTSTIQQSALSGYIYTDEEITVTTIPGPLINKILTPNNIKELEQQTRQKKQLEQQAEEKQRRKTQQQQAKATSSLPSTTTSPQASTTTTNSSLTSSASVCDPEPFNSLTKSMEDSLNTVQAQTAKIQLEQENKQCYHKTEGLFFFFLTKCQSGQSLISLKHHFLKDQQSVRWYK